MAGKGSAPRPLPDYDKYSDNWDSIFKKEISLGDMSMTNLSSTILSGGKDRKRVSNKEAATLIVISWVLGIVTGVLSTMLLITTIG